MTQPPIDRSRRRFFRVVAGDVLAGAVQALGAIDGLRSQAAEVATTYLSDPPPDSSGGTMDPEVAGAAGEFRIPFRYTDPTTLLVVDQRRLPTSLAEVSMQNAAEAAGIIRDMVVPHGPVTGQLAAIGLALSASRSADSSPAVVGAVLEGSADALRAARPNDVHLRATVDRMMARYAAQSSDATGPTVAAALYLEAAAIIAEATEDHGRLVAAGVGILPEPDGRRLNILTHGAPGSLAAGQSGSVLEVIRAAHVAGRSIHVWVGETRPGLVGSRLTIWELARAGVSHTLIPDLAAGHLIASGAVDAILVGALRVAANGDTANTVGTYLLAVLAGRHRIPFYVCTPLSLIDLATSDGTVTPSEDGGPGEVLSIQGIRVAPPGTVVANPTTDITPADLITGLVTDEGVLRAPYRPALEAAMDRRAARRLEASQLSGPPVAIL
jgi:methylthioribose-1-phosphate isomerase